MSDEIHSSIKDQQLLAERRDILCRAAAKLFRKNGFHGTTIPDIAEAAGMSVGSIYRYVAKKEDIMYLMLQNVSSKLEANIYSLVNADLPPFEKLFAFLSSYYRSIDGNKDYLHVVLRDMRWIDGFRDALQKQETRTIECFTQILQEGIQSGVFEPVQCELFAYNLVFLGHMWVMRAYRFSNQTIDTYILEQYSIFRRALAFQWA